MRLRDLVTDQEYLRQKEELLAEQRRLKEKHEDTEHRGGNWLELSEKTFLFARYARFWFENGSLKDRKLILEALGSN